MGSSPGPIRPGFPGSSFSQGLFSADLRQAKHATHSHSSRSTVPSGMGCFYPYSVNEENELQRALCLSVLRGKNQGAGTGCSKAT